MLKIASVLCLLIGFAHSYLGEKFILIRLFRKKNLPELFGSDFFTQTTLRFAWHITTVSWCGFAYILWFIKAPYNNTDQIVLHAVVGVFFLSGMISFVFSKGKHLSWIVFWSIAGLAYYNLPHIDV